MVSQGVMMLMMGVSERWFVSKYRDGAHALLEVRYRFLVGSGRPSMLMLVRGAAALATMRPVLLLRVLPCHDLGTTGGLSVGKEEKKPTPFPVDASGR